MSRRMGGKLAYGVQPLTTEKSSQQLQFTWYRHAESPRCKVSKLKIGGCSTIDCKQWLNHWKDLKQIRLHPLYYYSFNATHERHSLQIPCQTFCRMRQHRVRWKISTNTSHIHPSSPEASSLGHLKHL